MEVTNPKKEGKRIYNVMLNRDPDIGATVILVSAGMGGVKTSACLDYAEKIMQWYPSEKVFWRESLKSPVQFTKLIDFEYQIFIEKGYKLIFKNITNDSIISPNIIVFNDFKELLQYSKGQTLNIVFFKSNKTWIDFIEFLNNSNGWYTLVLDEIEDLFPSGTSGEDWHHMQRAADTIKHCRRGLVTIIGNCHKGHTIDYRVYDKIMIHLYGFGAKPDGYSRIRRECIDGLTKGEFWIEEEHSRFGYIKIKRIHKPIGDAITIFEVESNQ